MSAMDEVVGRRSRLRAGWNVGWGSLAAHAIVAVTVLALCSSCGGSSDSGSFARTAELIAVRFPDPQDVNPESEEFGPEHAPLLQTIEFEFSDAPDPEQVHRTHILVQDALGLPVSGSFEVSAEVVRFVPTLPLREAVALGDGSFDTGGTGLEPDHRYSVRIGAHTWPFVTAIAPELRARYADPLDPRGVLIGFGTTGELDNFFHGLPERAPRPTSTWPRDGAVGVTPQLYSDPEGRFPSRQALRVELDAPVHPGTQLQSIELIDLDDRSHDPRGLSLGVEVRVVENQVDSAVLEVVPSGILPFGHLLALGLPSPLRGLSEPPAASVSSVVASFRIADSESTVHDQLTESFDDESRRDASADRLTKSEVHASWGQAHSGVLQAAFAFEGSGVLGRFVPEPAGSGRRTVVLDTDRQVFPLLDGSTPDAPAGFEVLGGVFHFTDVDIPRKVDVVVRGSHPCRITATGTVRIAGSISVAGHDGTPDNAFDSGVTSVPGGKGGPGGGRGGEGHPIFHWPPGQISTATLVSPPAGGTGFGPGDIERVGGVGGTSGIRDNEKNGQYGTDQEIECREQDKQDSRAAGGGGGSYLEFGESGRDGRGNVWTDGRGGFVVVPEEEGQGWDVLPPGLAGRSPFRDGDASNDFFGIGGELDALVGGQGGGGGGSRTESYYCGAWCKEDTDSRNDEVCLGGEYGPNFGDSVSDARGGGAGGGGGALWIQALGEIEITKTGELFANGGEGRGGETTGTSSWGGPAGGGSGGAMVLQSAKSLTVLSGAVVDVRGGRGAGSGAGGAGILQLQVPLGERADVRDADDLRPTSSWIDPDNVLNPARFTSFSAAVSQWWDLGRTTERPPEGLRPGFSFGGLDGSGFVPTDAEGNVHDPDGLDLRCDYLGEPDPLRPGHYVKGREPRSNFVPPNASVQVLFQGADAIAPGSKEVDPNTITPWAPHPSIADGMQFLRTKIVFDVAADGRGVEPNPALPAVQWITVDVEF